MRPWWGMVVFSGDAAVGGVTVAPCATADVVDADALIVLVNVERDVKLL